MGKTKNPLGKWALKKMPDYLKETIDERDRLIESGEVNNLHVFFSPPNRKGAPHSVSTIPVADCANCSKCMYQCYDLRHDLINKTVRRTRAVNSAILKHDRDRFFRELNGYCRTVDKFRMFVGGDVTDADFFERFVDVVNNNPHCKFHLFTKNYDAVNEAFSKGIEIKHDNLHMRFSTWPGLKIDNPYNINLCEVIFDDDFVLTKPNSAICCGNCTECAILGKNCFDKNVYSVYIPLH